MGRGLLRDAAAAAELTSSTCPERGGADRLRACVPCSYIALVTRVLIAETGNPVCWLLPAVVGQLPIAVAKRRLHAAPGPAVATMA